VAQLFSLGVIGMISFYSNLQWIMLLAIFVVGFRHSYRAHRITRFTVLFTWALLTFHAFVFSYYGMCLGGPESNDFPDGTLTAAFLFLGWLYGLIVGVLAVGSWRALHGVPLFKFLSRHEKPDA
jgi:hypothetical protein